MTSRSFIEGTLADAVIFDDTRHQVLRSTMESSPAISGAIGVGFGTAGLGDNCYNVVLQALKVGFRKFDTA